MIRASVWAAVLALFAGQDPPERTRQAVERMKGLKSYSTTFRSELHIPNSDPMMIEGNVVWVTPAVLFLKYKASGGDEMRVIRVGEKVWMFHLQVQDWVFADEANRPGAGRGLQNPDEVLTLISKASSKAVSGGRDAEDKLDLVLSGEDMKDLLKKQVAQENFEWKQSKGVVQLWVGEGGLLRRLNIDAELASTDPKIEGKKILYKAEVQVKGVEKEFSLDLGEPLSDEILNAIESLAKVPDPLLAEVKKFRQGKR